MKALLVWVLVVTAPSLADVEPVTAELLDREVRATLEKPGNQDLGAAVGVSREGRTLLLRGYGYRDRERKLPMTEESSFSVASTTKAFGAFALALAQQEGRLDLGAPVRRYFPGFALKSAEVSEVLSLEDMLSHRTGLPRHDLLWYWTPFPPADLIRRMRFLDLHPDPNQGFRKGFLYNNLAYLAAGAVLERVTGTPWPRFLGERVLGPLHMERSHFDPARFLADDGRAVGYVGMRAVAPKPCDRIGPACSLHADARDLLRWATFHAQGGTTEEGKSLLSPEAMASLYHKRIGVGDPERGVGYGLGWFVVPAHGNATLVWHGGNIDGYTTSVAFVPEKRLAVAVLVNSHGSALAETLAMQLMEKLYPRPPSAAGPPLRELVADTAALADEDPPKLACAAVTSEDPVNEKKPDAKMVAAYSGGYHDEGYGEVHVRPAAGEGLELDYYGNQGTLRWLGGTRFLWDASVMGVTFRCGVEIAEGASGLSIALEPQVSPILFARKPGTVD